MGTQAERAATFLSSHVKGEPLLMPNAWDVGTAVIFASMGFGAVATTSSGFAATLGRLDGNVSLQEALNHSTQIATAVELPVSADSENLYAHEPDDVALTTRQFVETGVAGLSIEDFTGDRDRGCYDIALATDRVAAAAEVAHSGEAHVVVTARAESLLYGGTDLGDVITRLQAYQSAGADVLYAPGLRDVAHIKSVVDALDCPVNVLALPGAPSVGELAEVGVARISVGAAFSMAALGAATEAATELLEQGSFGYWSRAAVGSKAAKAAFGR
jgi:2-methylisocitrate lyase-like PEP mutase family enzyme